MKINKAAVLVLAGVAFGASAGYAARPVGPGIAVIEGKPAREAGLAALAEAQILAGKGSWELIAVGRAYYLSGDKARGQALFDQVTAGKQASSDWQRIAQVYADAGENDKVAASYERMLALDPKDDSGQAEVGAWYLRVGDRARGEALVGNAMRRHPKEPWHYIVAAEALLGVPPSR